MKLNTKKTYEFLKRHAISAVVTFVASFVPLVMASLEAFDVMNADKAAWAGLFLVVSRIAIKVLFENVLPMAWNSFLSLKSRLEM